MPITPVNQRSLLSLPKVGSRGCCPSELRFISEVISYCPHLIYYLSSLFSQQPRDPRLVAPDFRKEGAIFLEKTDLILLHAYDVYKGVGIYVKFKCVESAFPRKRD